MTVVETEKIDIVATRPDTAVVRLVIADHLDWNDVEGHLLLLQAKLNTYLTFVESGQLHELDQPPMPAAPEVRIEVAAQTALPDEARAFFAAASALLAERGIALSVEVRPGAA